MDENDSEKIAASRSFTAPLHLKESTQIAWRSDMYIPRQLLISEKCLHKPCMNGCCGEYYKKYEHDETPVKDSGTGDKKCIRSLTNSELEELETEVMKNLSRDLQTAGESYSSVDSNIKFFKTTCQQIFDTFYATMEDIELYKQRFHDILERNKNDSSEMEDFIKEMFQHIVSAESVPNGKPKPDENEDENSKESTASNSYDEVLHSVIESYKNDNYMTDSNTDETVLPKQIRPSDVFNIYLLGNAPCVAIRLTDRNMLSEINIKSPDEVSIDTQSVSAEDLKKLAIKKKEIEGFGSERQDVQYCDVEIPIRFSTPKKNIYLDEDFSCIRKNERSLMSKICGFLCKKFRKNV